MAAYAHPSGKTIEVFGTRSGDRGRSCEEHSICGEVLDIDSVVRIRKVQIEIEGNEESALAVYWITDGIDRCRVGFLPRHQLKKWKQWDGKIGQVIEVYQEDSESPTKKRLCHKNKGVCVVAIIGQSEHVPIINPSKKRKAHCNDDGSSSSSSSSGCEDSKGLSKAH